MFKDCDRLPPNGRKLPIGSAVERRVRARPSWPLKSLRPGPAVILQKPKPDSGRRRAAAELARCRLV